MKSKSVEKYTNPNLPFVANSKKKTDSPLWDLPAIGGYHTNVDLGRSMAQVYLHHIRLSGGYHLPLSAIVQDMMKRLAEASQSTPNDEAHASLRGQYAGFFGTITQWLKITTYVPEDKHNPFMVREGFITREPKIDESTTDELGANEYGKEQMERIGGNMPHPINLNNEVPMNDVINIRRNEIVTMSSLELVEFINSQRKEGEAELLHKNFLAKVPQVLGEETSAKFSADLPDSYGRGRRGYRFPKREACLMAMSYSYELQAKVFDRMTELEQGNIAIPKTLSSALRLAAEQAEKIEEQTALIEHQKPAVEFVARYVEAKSSKCLSDVAKLLKWNPRAFIKRLAADGVIFRRGGCWVPQQLQIDLGNLTVYAGESQGHAYQQTRVEPKGIEWMARKYAVAEKQAVA